MSKLISRSDAIRFALIPKKLYLKKQARRSSRKFEQELDMLRFLVPANSNAIDGGANKGVYSYYLSKICKTVHAFEPNPIMHAYLKAAVPRNVKTYQAALSDTSGTATFNIPTTGKKIHHTRGSLLKVQGEKGETGVENIGVQIFTLDSLGLTNIGFIKLDIEGHELAALRGAENIIKRDRPVIQVEATNVGGSSANDLVNYLQNLGYLALPFNDGRLTYFSETPGNHIKRNCLFLPDQSLCKTHKDIKS